METTSEIVLRIWLLPEIFFVLSSALEAENTINAKTFTQQRKQSTKAEQMYAKTIKKHQQRFDYHRACPGNYEVSVQ